MPSSSARRRPAARRSRSPGWTRARKSSKLGPARRTRHNQRRWIRSPHSSCRPAPRPRRSPGRTAASPSAGIPTAAAGRRPRRGWPRSTPPTTSCGPGRGSASRPRRTPCPAGRWAARGPAPPRRAPVPRVPMGRWVAGAWLAEPLRRALGRELLVALDEAEDVALVTPAATWASPRTLLAVTDRRLLWLLDDVPTHRVRTLRYGAMTEVTHRLRRPLRRVAVLRIRTTAGRVLSFSELRPATAAAIAGHAAGVRLDALGAAS